MAIPFLTNTSFSANITVATTGTFGGNVTAPNLIATTAVYSGGIVYGSNTLSLKKSNGNSYVDFDTNLNATFAGDINIGTGKSIYFSSTTGLRLVHDGSNGNVINGTGDLKISNGATDKDIIFKVKDGVSNVEVMRIDGSTSNVGIGTTSPRVKLHVNGTNASVGTIGTPKNDWYTTAYNGIQVGDGTTLWGRAGDSHFSGNYYVKNNSGAAQDTYINSLPANDFWLDNGSGSLKYRNAVSGTAGNAITFNTRFVVLNNGNFGIGTTLPSAKLNIVNTASTSIPALQVASSASLANNDIIRFQINGLTNGFRMFQNASSVVNYTFQDGNVGIGTTSPGARLDVVGNGDAILIRRSNGFASIKATSDNGGNLILDSFSTAGAVFINHYANRPVYIATGGGNVGIGTTSPTAKLHVAGTGLFTGLVSGITPVAAANFVTKAYVDGSSGGTGPFLPLAGGTMTGTNGVVFPDNFNLKIGTGSDLKIFHNATDSFIINEVGDLKITQGANDKDIIFESDNGSGGTATYFFLDGSKADGTGNLYTNFPDKSRLTFGDKPNGDLQIYHTGNDSYIEDAGTGDLRIVASATKIYDADMSHFQASFTDGGSVDLYYGGNKKFETTSTGIAVTGNLTTTDDITISNTSPEIYLTNTNAAKYNWMVAAQENVDQSFEITPSTAAGGSTYSTPALQINGSTSNAIFAGKITSGNDIVNATAGVYTWTGDTDTFIQRSAANEIAFKTGAQTALVLDSVQKATFTGDVVINNSLSFSTNGFADFGNIGTGAMRFKPSGNTLALTLTGANATIAGKATSTQTAASDSSITLTTKSYVDGLVTGVPVYKGTWDARNIAEGGATDGGNPDLRLAANKVLGNYYIVSTAGSASPNGGTTEPNSWNVGDWCIFSDVTPGTGTDLWQKIDNTSVISGAGTGQKVTKWEGAGPSETLTDGPITFSTSNNNSTFAGSIYANTIYSSTNSSYYIDVVATGLGLNMAGSATFAGKITVNGNGIDIDNDDDVRLRFDNAGAFKAGLQVATTAGDMIAESAVNDFAIRAQGNMLFASGGNTERLKLDTSGNATFAGDVKIAIASNQGNLFFGTADANYKIFGGGNYGYMGYNTGGYHRFLTNGTEVARINPTGVAVKTTNVTAALNVLDTNSTSVKATRIGNDTTSIYFYNTQADAVLAWTCGSYHHAEVVITASQTNGGAYNNLYIRGIWSNNHTSHHWDELEHVGGLTGSTITMSVGQNGSTTNSGRLELDFNYISASFATLNVRVTDFYGTHSYTIT